MDLTLIVLLVVVTALAFDFTNGFHGAGDDHRDLRAQSPGGDRGLVGAVLWNLVTWLFGMPSSGCVPARSRAHRRLRPLDHHLVT